MWVFVGFFVLTLTGGVLGGGKPPPNPEPSCPNHEHFTKNNPTCIKTCANRWVPDSRDCKPISGCVCNDGRVRLNDDATGRCVHEDECPNRCKDKYAVFKKCPNPCPLTCAKPNPVPCSKMCIKEGCECARGYILDKIGGKCIKPKDCPKKRRCKDPHAVFKKCPNPCPLTCAEPNPKPCSKMCLQTGCECARGYVLDRIGGKCIKLKDCPKPRCPENQRYVYKDETCLKTCGNRLLPSDGTASVCRRYTGCVCKEGYVRTNYNATGPCIRESRCPPIPTQCGINEEPTSCATTCPPQTCDSIYTAYDCPEPECMPGCDCISGHLRNSDGVCIKSEDCFEPNACVRPNEIASDCAITCPPQTCESLFAEYLCSEQKCSPGCNCIDGYLRDYNGVCIPSEECPDTLGCKGDPHATHVDCGTKCPKTCADAEDRACVRICVLNSCQCEPGYIFEKVDGRCVLPKDCPGGSPVCGANKTYSDCKMDCPTNNCAADDSRAIVACSMPNPCYGGCVCKPGYLRVGPGYQDCVLASDCPTIECTRQNEVLDRNPTNCFLERCEDRGAICDSPYPAGPRCVCKPGFYRNASDICVPESECPPLCNDPNATLQNCPTPCPATCDNPNTVGKPCPAICLPDGCVCNPGFILSETGGVCIKPENCPAENGCGGDRNATYNSCTSACPTTCADLKSLSDGSDGKACAAVCGPIGCSCKPGFVLTEIGGICIAPEDCPVIECGPNEVATNCAIACPPQSCESLNPYISYMCAEPQCSPGCNCIDGYLRDSNGVCIPSETCPGAPGCKGDPHATKVECGTKCPKTCDDADDRPCVFICVLNACQCEAGYIFDKPDGVCIKPEDCPGGSPVCGENKTYVDCFVNNCPTNDCPTDDSLAMIACSISLPCFGGCACKPGYLRAGSGDQRCILASECPPVECTRPNEVWDPNPSSCLLESCEDRGTYAVCDQSYPVSPRCVCKDGFYRNASSICVPESECSPTCTDPNATLQKCPTYCPATCDDPDAPNRPCPEVCLPDGCVCNPGFVLTQKEGGVCVKLEDCPPVGCGGDRNATESSCPSACPTTCADMKSSGDSSSGKMCPAVCGKSGCVCKKGYVLTEIGGKCVAPEDCPDSRNKRCKDPNAMFVDCPSPCQSTCDEPNIDAPCVAMCLESGCICKSGYIREKEGGRCIKPDKCPGKGCGGDPNASFQECRSDCPLTCADPDPNRICLAICRPSGCECNPGYVLTKKGGKCIKPELCPADPRCHEDRNATFKVCPSVCQGHCKNPDVRVCTDQCGPDSCVCKTGYLLSKKSGGKCIKPGDCPGGSPICPGANETYRFCYVGCPSNYCAKDDSRAIVVCDPIFPCPGGCGCKDGYLLTNDGTERCILSSECPPVECTRKNERYNPNPPICLRERESCESRNTECSFPYRSPPQCVCKPGYFRNNDDECVPESECPPNCGVNATFSNCPSPCQESCSDPDFSDRACITVCAEPGCVCNEGYLKTVDGSCISPWDCPGGSPKCKENMTYTDCKVECQDTYCPQNPNEATVVCDPVQPCPPGCVCKPGYLLLNTPDRICVLAKDCPPLNCTGKNEEWDPNPPNCDLERCEDMYLTCGDPTPGRPRCVCRKGFYRNKDGVCIPARKCPPKCGYNEVAVPCRQICPPQNCEIAYTEYACGEETKICEPGCDCLPDHLRNGSGICIPNEQCPYPSTPVCGINEIARDCRRICPPQSCASIYTLYRCIDNIPCEPGCDCVPNYLRDKRGICIPSEKCPAGPPPICGYNEVEVPCRQICPPQNCEIAYTDYACGEETKICEPGCDCLPDHLRNGSGICIPNEQCPYPSTPVCGINEIARDCRQICPPQSCESIYTLYNCIENIPCEPGCDCVPNYLRDKRGICIRSEKCPAGPCPISDECQRTCAEPNPPCPYSPPPENIDGCDCMDGYLLSERGGRCIPIDQCPPDLGCNGDKYAVAKQCPQPCPSTCDKPNAFYCKMKCEPVGCECKPGYLRYNATGRCVPPEKCPGGNPCGKNEQFTACKVECEDAFCPVDDSRDVAICEPPRPCLSGCICKLNHKRKSRNDRRCIVSSDCTPVPCKRPNEEWSTCPECLAENCEDVNNQPSVCNTLVLNCQPKCICKKNFFRNASGICIPAKDCPCQVPRRCQRTCEKPNPPNCPYNPPPKNVDGCDCKKGYILSKKGGKCIPIDKCPANLPCHGDFNAVVKRCPLPCPSTCQAPNAVNCKRMCDPIGCECKPGYLRSNVTGRCILPEKCPGGNPCGRNEHFTPCKVECRDAYCPVDDSRGVVICDPPRPCLSGCVCNLNHKRKSRNDRRCIKASRCPPIPCRRPNEVFNSCPSACLRENCVDINNQPRVCNPLVLNCQPACICKKNFFRNANDICIPGQKCPCQTPRRCRRTCENPNPPNCGYFPPPVNMDGCDCKKGYILSKRGGKCIPIDRCPC